MPILTSNYIASWYIVNLTNRYRLLESWSETINQATENKPMIQGDPGTHIMDIGGVYYSATTTSPIVIMGQPNTGLYDVFDIILEGLSVAQKPIDTTVANSLDYVLDSGTISIQPEGIKATANIENALGWANQKQYFGNTTYDFIGRTAKFYDTIFNFMGGSFLVKNAEFNIKVDIEKIYLIGQSQFPTYAVKGYTVEGRAVLITTPDSYDAQVLIKLQTPGVSAPINKSIGVKIIDQYSYTGLGYRQLNLGEYMEVPSVTLDMNPGQTIEATVNFKTYFRRSSVLA